MASALEESARRFRAQLERREGAAVATMRASLGGVEERIGRELDRVLAKIAGAQARGREPGVSFLYERGRLEGLRRQVVEEMGRYGRRAASTTARLTAADADAALSWTARMIEANGADRGISLAVAPFRPELVAQARANMAEGSPLPELFAKFGPDAAQRVEAGLVQGLALGQHPDLIARRIRADVVETYRGRSHLIARTESQRVVRAVSREAYRTSDVVGGWRWLASRDRTTCAACWAEHGSLHDADEVLDGHPGCRCVMVPELARTIDRPPIPGLEPGEELFARLPAETRRAILGPSKAAAYEAGEVRLRDFAHRLENERWGSMVREGSLVRAKAEARRRADAARRATSRPTRPADAGPQPLTLEAARGFLEPLAERAERMDALAAQVEARVAREVTAGARALRDSWTPEADRGYGAVLRGRYEQNRSAEENNREAYAFNAGNANSWHYLTDAKGKSRRLTLAQYREVWLAWSRGERIDGFSPPPGVAPASGEVLDLVTLAGDLRLRAGADRHIVQVLRSDDDDWRFEEADRRVALGEVQAAVVDGQLLIRAGTTALEEVAAPAARAARPSRPRPAPEPEAPPPPARGPISEGFALKMDRTTTRLLDDPAVRQLAEEVVADAVALADDAIGGAPLAFRLRPARGITVRGDYGVGGRYRGAGLGGDIEMSTTVLHAGADKARATAMLLHELGHAIDDLVLPGLKFATKAKAPELRDLMRAASASRGYAEAKKLDVGKRYYASAVETWARAFAQYVAERSGRPDLIRAVREFSGQWSDPADFAPIAREIERLLARARAGEFVTEVPD